MNNGSEAGAGGGEHCAWTAEYEVSQVPDVGRHERSRDGEAEPVMRSQHTSHKPSWGFPESTGAGQLP